MANGNINSNLITVILLILLIVFIVWLVSGGI